MKQLNMPTHLTLGLALCSAALLVSGCSTDDSDYYIYDVYGPGSHTLINNDGIVYQMNADISVYYFRDNEEHPHRNDYWNPGTILANNEQFDFYDFPLTEVMEYLPNMRFFCMSYLFDKSSGTANSQLCSYGFKYTRDAVSDDWGTHFVGSSDSIGWHIPAHHWTFEVLDVNTHELHEVEVCFKSTDDYIYYLLEYGGAWIYQATLQADSLLFDGTPIEAVNQKHPYQIYLKASVNKQYN